MPLPIVIVSADVALSDQRCHDCQNDRGTAIAVPLFFLRYRERMEPRIFWNHECARMDTN